jgi:predicted dehydrogenase
MPAYARWFRVGGVPPTRGPAPTGFDIIVPVTLRFGLLGTGYWAAETQATGLAGHPDADFVGVWGRDPAKAGALADRYGVRAFAEVDDLLDAVDAVAIALPPHVQAPLAIRAARAGRHLLLDKPVALDVTEADELVAAVDGSGVASLVFVTNRYRPVMVNWLERTVATPGWGGARVTMLGSIFGADSPYRDSQWRRERGGLWDLGPHALSIVLPVLGPVDEAVAVPAPYGTVHAILRHRDGAVTTMATSIDSPPGLSIWAATFLGEAGTTRMPAEPIDAITAFRAAIARLAANVAAGRAADPLDVRAGRDTVAVLAAAQASVDRGGAPQRVRY